MLVRDKIDKASTKFDGRRVIDYRIRKREVVLDPWEDESCIEPMSQIFCAGGQDLFAYWTHVSGSMPILPKDQQIQRVLEDLDTGYIYYRRPIDIERQQKWNADRNFRVTAEEW